jgi:hypothetical protein
MPYLASLDRRASEPVSSSPMGRHPRAARLFVVVTLVALLVGTSSLLAGRPDPRPVRTPDRGEGWVVHLPQLEGLLSNLSRLSISELRRGIERSRPLPISAALAALGLLGIGLLSWRFPLRRASAQPTYSARSRVAGPRAPPLQLI